MNEIAQRAKNCIARLCTEENKIQFTDSDINHFRKFYQTKFELFEAGFWLVRYIRLFIGTRDPLSWPISIHSRQFDFSN